MTTNPHFEPAKNWKAAKAMLVFTPREPKFTAGHKLQSLRIYVRDHKMRELAVADRTLEAYYGQFSFSQVRKGVAEARRLALEVSYGREPRAAQISGHEGRSYELGPVPEPDDIDGRSPAVVTWHDGEIHFLLASDEMSPPELLKIAASIYK